METWQIYLALTKINYGWKNHPIVKMWAGYEKALLFYGIAICLEWKKRRYKDNMLERFLWELCKYQDISNVKFPNWLGRKKFHKAMKSNLLRKDKKFYSKYKWNVPNNLSYVWFK